MDWGKDRDVGVDRLSVLGYGFDPPSDSLRCFKQAHIDLDSCPDSFLCGTQ